MESDHEALYLHQLQEFINDEDRIVTCSWLSRKLELDIKTCKILLETFLKDHRNLKPNDLGVTYVLLGVLEENDCNSVAIVKEEELEAKKKVFKTIISETIYSIQKGKEIDLNCVSMVDMFDVNNPHQNPVLGSIKNKNSIKRNLKVKKILPTVSRVAPTDKSKASHLFSKAAESKKQPILAKKDIVTENKSNEKPKVIPNQIQKQKNDSKTKPNQKNGIAGLFAKMPPKQEVKKPKLQETPAPMEVDDDDDDAQPKKTNASNLYDSDTDEEAKKIEESNKNKPSVKTPKQNKSRATKRQRQSFSSDKTVKKRKRIVEKNDSDSDDMFGGDDEENDANTLGDSEDELDIKETCIKMHEEPQQEPAPKNKKRKLVNKTFTDDDGYLVTESEYVYVSGSDEESEKEQKNPQTEPNKRPEEKPKKVENKKEVSPTKSVGKGKKAAAKPAANQPTLLNFFKKK